mgnify:CR=1 FL=1
MAKEASTKSTQGKKQVAMDAITKSTQEKKQISQSQNAS